MCDVDTKAYGHFLERKALPWGSPEGILEEAGIDFKRQRWKDTTLVRGESGGRDGFRG